MIKKNKNIFDFLKNICYIKDKNFFNNLSETEKKDYNIFMIQKWLSMEPKYICFISLVDKYAFNCLDKKMYDRLMLEILPKEQIFFKYIKKDKKKEKDDIVIECLVKKYEISKVRAQEYNQFLSKEDKQELLESFGVEEKIIKKVK